MKFTCSQPIFQAAVSNVSRAVSSKSAIPALEGILVKAKGNQIFLCGYDLEFGITTFVEASVAEEGDVIFGAKLFGDIIRSLPDETVTIEVDAKYSAVIRSGESEFSIIGIAASEYPDLPSVSGGVSVTLPQNTLKSMIRQTLFAVSTSDAKPVHTGTLFEIGDGRIRLVAVDGCRLAMRTEPVQCDEPVSFVVPGKTLSEVLKLMGEEDTPLSIGVGRRHIIFNIGSYSVISRLLEGEFLDYNNAIPQNIKTEVVVPTRRFSEAVERMSLVVNDRLKSPVRCSFLFDEVRFSCETAIGCAHDRFAIKNIGDEVEIGFNNRYLLDALRAAETDEVRIQMGGPLSPIKILPRDGDHFLFLVLPVRLKAAEHPVG
ncbi:MAG: DNA polymerase III subunit beta [Acutalibacteraceae bacterium]|jgi:DNA polymerase-3 subunit beta